MNSHPKDSLDELLRADRRQADLPPRFQAEVWQRIADRETASFWTPARLWIEEWAALLTRPRYATALIVAVMALGAGLAGVQSYAVEHESGAMQARYVSSIDPYAHFNR